MVSFTSSIFRPWYFIMALGETYNAGLLNMNCTTYLSKALAYFSKSLFAMSDI